MYCNEGNRCTFINADLSSEIAKKTTDPLAVLVTSVMFEKLSVSAIFLVYSFQTESDIHFPATYNNQPIFIRIP